MVGLPKMNGFIRFLGKKKKTIDVSEFSSDWERNRDVDATSSDAGSSFVVSQSTCELSEILSQQMFGRGVQSCSNAFWDQGLLLLLMVSLMENHPPIFVTNYLQKVQALQLYKIDVGTVVLEIINTNIGDHLSPTVDGRSLMLLPISKPMNLSHVEMTF
ncbi:unnamed protein product [Trifolium pratense]|uniref:Uncharacterized protein n=1 Tax=Trifolium pratense TaxID=57577 RepID=A0ACB0JHS0_TRIPR|nr:unnamed protein product [Trifolium pratense]